MAIVITDEDARRLLSMEECIEAMRVAFRDLGQGKAIAMPRMRYTIELPDPARRYFANVHIGAVASYGTACVRAGSHFILDDDRAGDRRVLNNPDPVNWSVIILYDLATAEPIAFLHESYLSGLRVGATTGAAVAAMARDDAATLGLFGTGRQAASSLRAIRAVRPITRVNVYSPSAERRAAFAERMTRDGCDVVAVSAPRAVIDGADIVSCATNTKAPVFDGDWLSPGQMVVSIVNSDVTGTRREVDETTFARADDIIINDRDSVHANRQVELLEPIEKGLVDEARLHTLADILGGAAQAKSTPDNIVYYKNNTGLALQFAAAGAILYKKLSAEGTHRVIPRDWLAAEKYSESS